MRTLLQLHKQLAPKVVGTAWRKKRRRHERELVAHATNQLRQTVLMASPKERRFSLFDPHASRTKRLLYKCLYVYLPMLWEALVACSGILSTFIVTYQSIYHAGLLWQWVVVYAMDLVYVGYMVYRFFRPFKRRGEIVKSKKKIVLNYIRTTFFFDLLSILPLEIFSVLAANPVYIAAFLRLNRCIRCYKAWTLLCKS